MKRDMELIRTILLKLEEHEHGHAPRDFQIEGYTQEQIGYHVHLMGQADLLQVSDNTHMGSASPEAIPLSITWEGHDFLDAARSDTIWNRAKKELGGMFNSVPIEIIKAVLVKLAKQTFGVVDV